MAKNITVIGVEETIRKIGLFEIEKRTNVKKLVKKYALDVKKEAQRNIPDNYPTTRKSIRVKSVLDGMGATVYPRRKHGGYKAHWIEYGTKDRRQKKSKRYVGRIKKQPFMGPAHRKYEKKFEDDVKKVVDKDVTI